MKQTYILVLVLAMVALTACSSASQATPTPAASTANVPAVVTASGKVLPARWANMSFQTGGLLLMLNVQTGDTVKAGDVIAQINDTDARLTVSQAEAALTVAQ